MELLEQLCSHEEQESLPAASDTTYKPGGEIAHEPLLGRWKKEVRRHELHLHRVELAGRRGGRCRLQAEFRCDEPPEKLHLCSGESRREVQPGKATQTVQ